MDVAQVACSGSWGRAAAGAACVTSTWSSAAAVAAAAADAMAGGPGADARALHAALGALLALTAVGAACPRERKQAPMTGTALHGTGGTLPRSLAPLATGLYAGGLAGAVFVIAPALSTLAASISDDTLLVCAGALLLLHVALDDYGAYAVGTHGVGGSGEHASSPKERARMLARAQRSHPDPVQRSASASAGTAAALLLASRLDPRGSRVGSFLMLALAAVLLAPRARRKLRLRGERTHFAASYASAAATAVALWRAVSPWAAALHVGETRVRARAFVCPQLAVGAQLHTLTRRRPLSLRPAAVVLAIGVACPLLLVTLHPHKRTISGPWDEARPAAPPEALRAKGCTLMPVDPSTMD